MTQRLDVTAIRADGSRVALSNQASDSQLLWDRIFHLAQTAQSISIQRHAVAPPTPPTTGTPPIQITARGQRVVYFSEVTDEACREFAACGPGYTARLSADVRQSEPGGAYHATDEQIRILRSGGGRVEGWCDGDQTWISRCVAFVRARGLDGASAQFETPEQWRLFRAAGLDQAIGNPSALRNASGDPLPELGQAIDLAKRGVVALIGEVMTPDPTYSAQGVPIAGVCFYVDRDAAQGGYQPLAVFGVMPRELRATCSVYTGAAMRADDWRIFRLWTKPA